MQNSSNRSNIENQVIGRFDMPLFLDKCGWILDKLHEDRCFFKRLSSIQILTQLICWISSVRSLILLLIDEHSECNPIFGDFSPVLGILIYFYI